MASAVALLSSPPAMGVKGQGQGVRMKKRRKKGIHWPEKATSISCVVDTRLKLMAVNSSAFKKCKLLNGVIPALIAMSNIAVRYHCFCDGQV